MVTGRQQQFIKWRPVVPPVAVKTESPPELCFCDLASPPCIQNALVTGEYGFESHHHAPALRAPFDQFCDKSLRCRERVIIPDQQRAGGADLIIQLVWRKDRIILPECVVK